MPAFGVIILKKRRQHEFNHMAPVGNYFNFLARLDFWKTITKPTSLARDQFSTSLL